ncbi:uncharacterized protein [Epargyreus clarus]|uniref:uncharacterized protein n=1 Tax=Epargyreus clarus TaxID=520877 RepID=UPI003C2E79E3
MQDQLWISAFPTEIFLQIFAYLPVKHLVKCRLVSSRWREIVDELTRSDIFWKRHCEFDFGNVSKVARKQCRVGMDWCSIYRSLSLWARLGDAIENRNEFCSAADVQDEIRNCIILRNGVIGVHKRGAIVYYDVETLKPVKRPPITGNYLKYSENDDFIAILNFHLQLFVQRKDTNESTTYENIKKFFLLDHALYYVNLNDNLYSCRLDKILSNNFVVHSNHSIVAVSYSNERLQLLTFERKIYTVVDSKLSFATSLGTTPNLLHLLHQYNFLEVLDWRIYFHWMFVLNKSIPQSSLQDIVTTRIYGDVVFVGSKFGILRIYYKPYTLGEFDIFNAEPIKQYNFMERSDCPEVSMCPIFNIDVLEGNNGHTVIVAMPKKIAILNFTHNLLRTFSALPYPEMDTVKIITIN